MLGERIGKFFIERDRRVSERRERDDLASRVIGLVSVQGDFMDLDTCEDILDGLKRDQELAAALENKGVSVENIEKIAEKRRAEKITAATSEAILSGLEANPKFLQALQRDGFTLSDCVNADAKSFYHWVVVDIPSIENRYRGNILQILTWPSSHHTKFQLFFPHSPDDRTRRIYKIEELDEAAVFLREWAMNLDYDQGVSGTK